MGSANGGRFGTVSHSQWSSGRTTAPANPNICTLLAGPCGGLDFISVLRVSLTPLTDYLIWRLSQSVFSLLSISFYFLSSLHLGYLVRYTCLFLFLLASLSSALACYVLLFCELLLFFVPTVLPPVLDTGSDEDLGREGFLGGWMGMRHGWAVKGWLAGWEVGWEVAGWDLWLFGWGKLFLWRFVYVGGEGGDSDTPRDGHAALSLCLSLCLLLNTQD